MVIKETFKILVLLNNKKCEFAKLIKMTLTPL